MLSPEDEFTLVDSVYSFLESEYIDTVESYIKEHVSLVEDPKQKERIVKELFRDMKSFMIVCKECLPDDIQKEIERASTYRELTRNKYYYKSHFVKNSFIVYLYPWLTNSLTLLLQTAEKKFGFLFVEIGQLFDDDTYLQKVIEYGLMPLLIEVKDHTYEII